VSRNLQQQQVLSIRHVMSDLLKITRTVSTPVRLPSFVHSAHLHSCRSLSQIFSQCSPPQQRIYTPPQIFYPWSFCYKKWQ